MSGEHTPGPWSVEIGDGRTQYVTGVRVNGDRTNVAKCSGNLLIGHDEVCANARLIAAAPETAAERDRLRAEMNIWKASYVTTEKYANDLAALRAEVERLKEANAATIDGYTKAERVQLRAEVERLKVSAPNPKVEDALSALEQAIVHQYNAEKAELIAALRVAREYIARVYGKAMEGGE